MTRELIKLITNRIPINTNKISASKQVEILLKIDEEKTKQLEIEVDKILKIK